ncbi:MAG: hypothetical protein ACE5H8_11705 [Alphaproteobacteria bacterium]
MANCLNFPVGSAAGEFNVVDTRLSPRAALAVWVSLASIGWGLIYGLAAALF